MIRLLLRSGKWRKLRKEYLKRNPSCAACGGTTKLEVHHLVPVSMDRSLELVESNLLVLCESRSHGILCHLAIGHRGNYRKHNPTAREDAAYWLEKLKGA